MELETFLDCGAVVSIEGGEVLVGWGRVKHLPDPPKEGPSFYLPDFFLEDPIPWKQFEHSEVMGLDQLLDSLGESEGEEPLVWKNPYRKHFCAVFEDLQERFAKGELHKAVPYVFSSTSTIMESKRLVHCLRSALMKVKNHPLFLYGYWNKGEGMLGATPEKLACQQGEKMETVAIAGTGQHAKDLLNDPKERYEHQLVIDGIVEQLSTLGDVSIGSTTHLQLPTFVHLMTPIEIYLRSDVSLTSVIKALHPTPALGVFPPEKGSQWLIDQNKLLPRKRFGAPVGVLQPQKSCFNSYVAIRNVQWDERQILMGAGCGVVPQSECLSEWEEIQLKLQSIQEALQI